MSVNDYAHISSRIKALELDLPDNIDIERMLDAPSFEDAFKVLNDTDYADNLLNKEPHSFNDALEEDNIQLKEFLKNNVPSTQLVKMILLKGDWHNIKTLLKVKLFSLELNKDNLSNFSNISVDHLEKYILEDKKEALSDESIKDEINEVITKCDSKLEPQIIDITADNAYFNKLSEMANQFQKKSIIDYTKTLIDIANIKLVTRSLLMHKPKNWVAPFLSENGHIDSRRLLSFYDEAGFMNLISYLKTHLKNDSLKYLEEFGNEKNLQFLEKALDTHLNQFFESWKLVAFGPEIVIQYFHKKTDAIQNIRIIMIGKLNHLSREDIKYRLNPPS